MCVRPATFDFDSIRDDPRFQARLVDETDRDERAGLEKKLALVHAQRKKGLRLQKTLLEKSKN